MTFEGILLGLIALAWGGVHLLRLQVLPGPAAPVGVRGRLRRRRPGAEHLFGDGFLATVSGWVVGFLLGAVFAVISTSGTGRRRCSAEAGYTIGVGLMGWLGIHGFLPWWWASSSARFAVGTIMLRAPGSSSWSSPRRRSGTMVGGTR